MIDKCIYSFWSKPCMSEGVFVKYAGFKGFKNFARATHLSVLYSKENFKDVVLYTDTEGKKLLIDYLKLPFDKVEIILDDISNIDPSFWAFGKIKALSLQKEPFLHIDFDVFLFKKLPNRLLEADCFFQCKEIDYYWYKDGLQYLIDSNFSLENVNFKENIAYNCGIMGFNDLSIINLWFKNCQKFVEFFKDTFITELMPNILFEQHQIYHLINNNRSYNNIQLIGEEHTDVEEVSEEIGYTHLLAKNKNIPTVIKKVEKKLERDFPKEYKKLEKVLNDRER